MNYDVAVIGAGPAGALAALGLARAGASVALIEQATFPRHKVCGGCLHPRALATLERLGLTGVLDRHDAPAFDRLRLAVLGRQHTLFLNQGRSISRWSLDAALATEAGNAGCDLRTGTALESQISGAHRVVQIKEAAGATSELTASLVVAASGLTSAVAGVPMKVQPGARIGAGLVLEPSATGLLTGQTVEAGEVLMMVTDEGYVGAVRAEGDRLVVAAALDPESVRERGGIAPLVQHIVSTAGVTGLDLSGAWRGTPQLTRTPAVFGAERLLLLGDASGYVEPFTGEGMAWAMAAAESIVPLAQLAVTSWSPAIIDEWQATLRSAVGAHWACRAATNLVRHPLLLSLLVRLGPRLSGHVVRRAWSPA